ncbi:MAG: FAD-dependent oxidoreductase [Desulfobacteraceae bacterium]|nr:FAD-dependent oxidoreductase [Desulfobacteraceae bacterium]
MKDPLFQPIKINQMDIKNRIYMPAMALNMTNDYKITDRLVDFYAERARGGAGMICVGLASVDEMAGGPMLIGAHTDEMIPGLAKCAAGINDNGSRSVLQINHAGRYNHSFMLGGKLPLAPSAVASNLTGETPRAMEIEEIKETVQNFAKAAGRVKKAGFDAVEVLSGTGYLISQFLSPLTNIRTDEYGGSYENRMRFPLEIMAEIRKEVGNDYPLMVRMNGNDFMEGGQGRLELQKYAKALVEIGGVDALCINVGWHEARVPQIVTCVPRATFAYMAKEIKKIVDVPVIASHRINDPETAREIIADDFCDMVAMGRGLITDPYLPEKARTGREKEIVHCIACAQGCFDHVFEMTPIECLCNPKAGYETTKAITKTDSPKKVLVVGGGAAGMSAALAACEKGHNVTIYEKSDRLGGELFIAALPPGRAEFELFAKDLETQVKVNDIKVVLNTEVDEALIKSENPDSVILSTGAEPLTPPIPGVDGPNVVQAWDVLNGKVYTGNRVIVIGGGAVGVETALFLAEKGTLTGDQVKFLLVNKAEPVEDILKLAIEGTKDVTLIEMVEKVGKDIGRSTKWVMMRDLNLYGVNTMVGTKAVEITETGVKIEKGTGIDELEADTIIMAAGSSPLNPFQEIVEKMGIECNVIGDAKQIGLAYDAVHQGYDVGRSI